jgi:hypothetical protein
MQRRHFLHMTMGALSTAGAARFAVHRIRQATDAQCPAERAEGHLPAAAVVPVDGIGRLVPGLDVDLRVADDVVGEIVVKLETTGPAGDARGSDVAARAGHTLRLTVPYPGDTLVPGRYLVRARCRDAEGNDHAITVGGYEILPLRFGA